MEPIETTWQMWASFAVIGVAVVAYALERWAMKLTSVATILALMLIFHLGGPVGDIGVLGPGAFLSGFAAPALINILALMVVGQGLIRTDAIEAVVAPLVARLRPRPLVTGATLFLAVALLSAFINNTPVVVIFIPLATVFARRADVPAARWMMGLSFAAILGGMTTLIGSSTNLLVAGTSAGHGGPVIGFFDFAVTGLVLAAVGILYLLFIAPRLLPDRASLTRQYMGEGRHYVAQITVRETSRLIGERAVAGRFPALADMTVRLFQRGTHVILPPYDDVAIQPGDVLVVAATREVLAQALANTPSLLPPDGEITTADQLLVEAMVAPTSRMIGRPLAEIGFHYQTGCLVLGVQRRSRMLRSNLDAIRLEVGDVLLLLGPRERVHDLRADANVVLLERSARELAAPAQGAARRRRLRRRRRARHHRRPAAGDGGAAGRGVDAGGRLPQPAAGGPRDRPAGGAVDPGGVGDGRGAGGDRRSRVAGPSPGRPGARAGPGRDPLGAVPPGRGRHQPDFQQCDGGTVHARRHRRGPGAAGL